VVPLAMPPSVAVARVVLVTELEPSVDPAPDPPPWFRATTPARSASDQRAPQAEVMSSAASVAKVPTRRR
jgi:hypothetical protein